MKKFRIFVLIAALSTSLIIDAQVTECSWYTSENTGLCTNDIIGVLPGDNYGLLVASNRMAHFFDGEHWTLIPQLHFDDLYNIGSIDFSIDQDKNIWSISSDGLTRISETGEYTYWGEDDSGISSSNLTSAIIKNSNEIFIGTFNSDVGVLKFDGEDSWTEYNFESYGGNQVMTLGINNDSTEIWFGLYYYGFGFIDENEQITFINFTDIGMTNLNNLVYCIEADSEGNIWIGTAQGIIKYNSESSTIFNMQNSGLPNNRIKTIAFKNNNMWVGTNEGIAVYNGSEWTVYNTSNSDLPNNEINSIKNDTNDVIWIACLSGLVKVSDSEWIIYNENNTGLISNDIYDIEKTADGSVLLAVGDGLNIFDGEDWTHLSSENSPLPNYYIDQIEFDQNSNLWIGSYNGLFKYDFNTFTNYTADNSGLSSDKIKVLLYDNDILWIATENGGLCSFNGTEWQVFNTSNSGFIENNIPALTTDHNGKIWIGFYNGGISSYDGSVWETYTSDNSGLPAGRITSLTYNDGLLYIGIVTGGMATFDGSNWLYYGGDEGLNSQNVYSLTNDGEGVFVCSDRELQYFINEKFHNVDLSNCCEGVYHDEFLSYYFDDDGSMWAGSYDGGLFHFNYSYSSSVNEYNLLNNYVKTYPNPFSSSTTIEYELRKAAKVSIKIYNPLGIEIESILQHQSQGKHQINWDASSLASGIYYYKINADNQIASGKMFLVR